MTCVERPDFDRRLFLADTYTAVEFAPYSIPRRRPNNTLLGDNWFLEKVFF